MAIEVVDRTFVASIRNQREVQPDLDALGFAASKLWNVGAGRVTAYGAKLASSPTKAT